MAVVLSLAVAISDAVWALLGVQLRSALLTAGTVGNWTRACYEVKTDRRTDRQTDRPQWRTLCSCADCWICYSPFCCKPRSCATSRSSLAGSELASFTYLVAWSDVSPAPRSCRTTSGYVSSKCERNTTSPLSVERHQLRAALADPECPKGGVGPDATPWWNVKRLKSYCVDIETHQQSDTTENSATSATLWYRTVLLPFRQLILL